MGPIALFDKSFLQSLSTDESVWFDHFFYSVIAPVFYIETLADLEKAPRTGKSAEEEVGIIAAKTPQMTGAPCYFHQVLCLQDLHGNPVPMTGQIPMAGARQVVRDGKIGAIIEETPEARAFGRWQAGRFHDVERQHARAWRAQLERTDLGAIQEAMQRLGIKPQTCRTLADARRLAGVMVASLAKSSGRFEVALALLDVPDAHRRSIKERWKRVGKPQLMQFAPYAAHVLCVEVFFRVALGANLIAATRASNRADIAYLFYVPFCQIFISTDRLHRICTSHFLRPDQEFVWGAEIKSDLKILDAHYKSLPEDTKSQGIYKFAPGLPDESVGKVRVLFQRFTPNLLKPRPQVNADRLTSGQNANIVGMMKEWDSAPEISPATRVPEGDMETLILKRSVARRRGSWLQIGPEVKD